MNRKFDACVFDLDGTLVNSLMDLALCTNEALRLFELPDYGIDDYTEFVGNGIANLIKRAMGDKAEDEKLFRSVYDTFNLLYDEKCLDYTRPYQGVTEMLRELRDSGVKIGVLSNKTDSFAKRIVGVLFDSSLIDVVYGQRDDFPRKPEPDSLYAMLKELGVPKERCLYIGDSCVDINTAKNADVTFCGVGWGFGGYVAMKHECTQLFVKTPDEITDAVLEK